MALGNDINLRIGATDATGTAFRSAEMRMKSLAGAARTMAGALGIAFGAREIIRFTKSVIDYGSSLTDAATATNTNIEALQVFRYHAELAGAKVENMDKALIQVNKSAVDASNGLSTSKRAFEYLGINVERFINLPTEQKLTLLARQMNTAEDKNRAMAAAMDILGTKNAPKLMEVLQKLGRDGYGSLEEAAKRANAVMSELDAKKLDDAADAVLKFQRATMVRAAPILGFWGEVMTGGWDSAVKSVMDGNKKVEASMKSADAAVSGIGNPDYSASESFYKAGSEYKRYWDRLIAADRSKDLGRAELGLKPIDRSMFDSVRSFGDVWAGQMERIRDESKKAIGMQGVDMTSTQIMFGRIAKSIEGYSETMASNMTDAIMEFARTGKMEFRSFANSVLQDIARIMMYESIASPIAKGITGIISGSIGGFFGGGGGAVAGAKAAGGPIFGGSSYLVGEKGPEIITASSNGTVIPNSALSGGTIINFNINAMDSQSFSTHLAKHKREITGIVEGAYKTRGKRGPLTA